MDKLYLDKDYNSIQIAEIANFNSKEQVVFGDYDRDLILRAKGGVTLQIQNKFYSIPLQEVKADGTIVQESNIGYIDSITNISGVYPDGYLLFDTSTKILYFFYNNEPIPLISSGSSGGGNTVLDFISYTKQQNLSPGQRNVALQNLGVYVDRYTDLVGLMTFTNEVVYVGDRLAHFALDQGIWKELYVNAIRGGLIHNNIGIIPPNVDYTAELKALLSIPVNNPDFHLDDSQLNGLRIGEGLGLKLYGTPYANVIHGGVDKEFRIAANTELNNIYMVGDKTSFGTTVTIPTVNQYFEKGISTDKLFIRDSITSPIYTEDLGFNIDQYGNARFIRNHVVDPETTYIHKGIESAKYIQESYLLDNIDENGGVTTATFRNQKDLEPGDLLLGLVYNKAKSLDKAIQIEVISLASNKAVINPIGDLNSYSDMEVFKVGNKLKDTYLTILDPQSKALNIVKGVKAFSELQLPDINNISEDSIVTDQNNLPELPIYTQPLFPTVITSLGLLDGVTDLSLNPAGYGIYSNNAFIKGKADLNYLKLGDQMKFENGVLTFADGIVDGYRKYGLGVTASVPYSVSNAAGLYGMLGTASDSPISAVSGSVLRMQSGAVGHQSEIWLSGTVPTAKPKAFIRTLKDGDKGGWSRLYTDSDITSTQIVNWDNTFSWGNHAGRYPNRATLSPTGTNSVFSADTRDINSLPTTNIRQGVAFDFKRSTAIGFNTIAGTNTYAAAMTFVPYTDDSGNNFSTFQLAQSAGMMGYRHYNAGVWSAWRKILTSGDFVSTNFMTLDTEQTVSAYKSYTAASEDRYATNFVRLKNLRSIIGTSANISSIKVGLGNPMAAVMWEAVIELQKYTPNVNTYSTYPQTTEIRITGYNSTVSAALVNTSVRVTGDPGAVTNVNYYKDASNRIFFVITGSFSSYPKVIFKELNLHHNVTQPIIDSIKLNTILEFSTDITGLTAARTVSKDLIDYVMTDKAMIFMDVNETKGVGVRLRKSDPLNYGNIGLGAFDVSTSIAASDMNGATGNYSFAAGDRTIAGGIGATVFGKTNSVTGNNSISSGDTNIVTTDNSAVFGKSNKIDQTAHNGLMIGDTNTLWQGASNVIVGGANNTVQAGGNNSLIVGSVNISDRGSSNAIIGGSSNTVYTGGGALIVGNNNEVSQIQNSLISGSNNFVMGFTTGVLSGNENKVSQHTVNSIMAGDNNTVHLQNRSSIIIGERNQIYGYTSIFAGGTSDSRTKPGINNTVKARNSFTYGEGLINNSRGGSMFGIGNINNSASSLVIGVFNDPILPEDTGESSDIISTNPAFIVGNGGTSADDNLSFDYDTNSLDRRNAYVLRYNGKSTQYGIAEYGANYSEQFTDRTLVDKAYVLTNSVLTALDEGNGIGYRLRGFDPEYFGNIGLGATDFSIKYALPNTAPFLHLAAFVGKFGATGRFAFAGGGACVAQGNQSVAFGQGSVATGTSAFTAGLANQAIGSLSVALGNNTIAGGESSFAIGVSHNVTGKQSFAGGGSVSVISGINSGIIGGATNTITNSQSVILGGLRNTTSGITTFIANSQDTSITGNGSSIMGSIRITNAGDSCSIISSSDANITAGIGSAIILASRNVSIIKDPTSGGGTAQAIIASSNSKINAGQPNSTNVTKWNNAIIAGEQCTINSGMSYNLVTGQGTIGTASGQFVCGLYNEDEIHLSVTNPLKKTFVIGGGGNTDLGGGVLDKKTIFYIQHNGLVVATNDIEIKSTTKGYVLPSPDGSRWRITIDDAGELIRTKIT